MSEATRADTKAGVSRMTPADWEDLKRRLSWPMSAVELNCDGYHLSIQRHRVSEMRDMLVVYVNGCWRGEWISKDCEERRRFFRPKVVHVWSTKIRHSKTKRSKRLLKSMGVDIDAKGVVYSPYWTSFGALKRHLIKNNKEISLWTEPVAPPSSAAIEEASNG